MNSFHKKEELHRLSQRVNACNLQNEFDDQERTSIPKLIWPLTFDPKAKYLNARKVFSLPGKNKIGGESEVTSVMTMIEPLSSIPAAVSRSPNSRMAFKPDESLKFIEINKLFFLSKYKYDIYLNMSFLEHIIT